jgi:hypothetical protein
MVTVRKCVSLAGESTLFAIRKAKGNGSEGAWRRLGLIRPPTRTGQFMSPLTYIARAVGGKSAFMDVARLSVDRRVRELVRRWDGLSRHDQRYISLDALCEACGIEPAELFGAAVASCHMNGLDAGPIVASSFNYLLAVEALIRGGLRVAGESKRERLLRQVGLLN